MAQVPRVRGGTALALGLCSGTRASPGVTHTESRTGSPPEPPPVTALFFPQSCLAAAELLQEKPCTQSCFSTVAFLFPYCSLEAAKSLNVSIIAIFIS